MKLEPRLPQLPSLGELLEHPRVKVLVQRINRSTLAQRAGGFLEEMRSSLAERAGRIEAPSLAHLAERLARRLLGEPTTGGPVINATGVVFGDDALASPLPESALHAIVQLAGEYHCRDAALRLAAERGLSDLAGSEAAYLTASFHGAVTLAAAAMAGNRELVVHGNGNASTPIDWRWIAARAGASLSFRTPTPSLSPAEGCAGTRRGAAAIIRAPEADDPPGGVDLAVLAAEAAAVGACVVDVTPVAGTINPRDFGHQDIATIKDRLAAGADLVVASGAGLLGGPACGVIVGRRRLVEQVSDHPLASLMAVDPLDLAALEALLRLYRDDATAPAVYQLPVWQLLSAPLANLEQRALRLATLMSESRGIASAGAREVESPWRRWGARAWPGKSWAIELRPTDGDAAALASFLARGPLAITSRQSADAVDLDLRTVFPRWDQQLVAAVDAACCRD